jgi:septal ring factor EnvC (AmiA/AmiB activator)
MALLPVISALCCTGVNAEARRDGGGDQALRKAQYLIRQLSEEKSELQGKVIRLEEELDRVRAELEDLKDENKVLDARLNKSRSNNEQLVERVRSDLDKFKKLLERYRETAATLRQATVDNQYLVRAVQEREHWMQECRGRNQDLFAANSDLLERYRDVATRHSEPFTGIGKVTVENEVQDYRFKLEDLQVTEFRSSVDVADHSRDPDYGRQTEEATGAVN